MSIVTHRIEADSMRIDTPWGCLNSDPQTRGQKSDDPWPLLHQNQTLMPVCHSHQFQDSPLFTVSFDGHEFKKSVLGEIGSERVINGLKNGFRILKPKTVTS